MKKKTITILGMAALALSACGAAENFTEGVQDGYESSMNEETEDVFETEENQEQLAIVFTQNALENNGFEDYDSGTSQYTVNKVEVDDVTRWNVTASDSNYGRIKAMFDWDGSEQDGEYLVTHQYLLVGGEEIYDNR